MDIVTIFVGAVVQAVVAVIVDAVVRVIRDRLDGDDDPDSGESDKDSSDTVLLFWSCIYCFFPVARLVGVRMPPKIHFKSQYIPRGTFNEKL